MSDIRSALVARLLSSPALIEEARVSFENVSFVPPAKGTWIEVDYMPASSTVNTLGTGGKDQDTGILQILINEPKGSGVGKSSALVQQFRTRFYAGLELYYGSQVVSVTRVQQSPSFSSNTSYKTPLSIYWKSKRARPST
jgi:hypothetical protein